MANMGIEIDIVQELDSIKRRKPQVVMNDGERYLEIMNPDGSGLYEDFSYEAVETPHGLLKLIYFLSTKTIFSAALIIELVQKCSNKFGYEMAPFDADTNA